MRGHLRQRTGRPKDYWEIEVDAGRDPVTGRRLRVLRSVRGTKREAERALTELVVEVSNGRVQGTSATLGELIVRWLEHVGPDLSPKTLLEYQRVIDRRILPGIGKKQLRRLLTSDLDAFYRQLSQQGLAPATVRRAHNIVRTALGQGVRWGWLATNPATNASPPSVPRPDVHPPDPATVLVLLEAARKWDVDFGDCLHLAAATGARRSELCGLRWENVDLDRGQVLIDRAIIETGASLYEKDTETHAARRIALDQGSVAMLRGRLERRQMACVALGLGWNPSGFVLSDDPTGSAPWRPGRITLAFGRLCRQRGVSGVRLHDLRHFSATRLLASGIDVRTVAGRLGHANAATTLSVYSHFVDAADRRAATILGDLISENSTE